MSHSSSRKRSVPTKVKIKEPRASDLSSVDEEIERVVEGLPRKRNKNNGLITSSPTSTIDWLNFHHSSTSPLPQNIKKDQIFNPATTTTNNNNIFSNGSMSSKQITEFKEQASPQDDTLSNETTKDDEDDDDDESDEKIDSITMDPERLKAFNMFVRLFVDENLDRMVPISKQPKEKIQAIIDSCTRQFPEFAERARKRIRTYLKSCRRNKRSRDNPNGWESSRPTPAHLTSVEAEVILAQACENESQNAKRMRMGLEPLPQPLPTSPQHGAISTNGKDSEISPSDSRVNFDKSIEKVENLTNIKGAKNSGEKKDKKSRSKSSKNGNSSSTGARNKSPPSPSSSDSNLATEKLNEISTSIVKPTADRGAILDYSRTIGSNSLMSSSMYRPNFCQSFTRPTPFTNIYPNSTTSSANLSSLHSISSTGIENNMGNKSSNNCSSKTFSSPIMSPISNGNDGPTDLSMKSSSNIGSNKSLLPHKLSSTEMTTVKQLITGYRESAAFLLRSADELEQLIIQQH